MAKVTRWCLNVITLNVKPWNKNMIGIENIVECTKDGVPLTTIKYMEKLKLKDTDNTTNVIEDTEQEVNEVAKVKEQKPVELTPDEPTSDESIEEERELREQERTRRLQVYTSLTKKNLIAMARNTGVKFTGTDAAQRNKLWFATRIADAEMELTK